MSEERKQIKEKIEEIRRLVASGDFVEARKAAVKAGAEARDDEERASPRRIEKGLRIDPAALLAALAALLLIVLAAWAYIF